MKQHWLDDVDGLMIEGDVLEGLAGLHADSVDAIVTDPPYGLEFMDKDWDKDFLSQLVAYGAVDEETAARWKKRARGQPGGAAFSKPGIGERDIGWPSFGGRWQNRRCIKCGHISSGGSPCECDEPEWVTEGPQGVSKPLLAYQLWCELWARECLRVLKPGGHMIVFGGTRTHHRMWCAVEDVGFEVREMLLWLYGQGFPKNYNVGQAVEKLLTTGKARRPDRDLGVGRRHSFLGDHPELKDTGGAVELTTEEARAWEGWGTGLKPGVEPILLARKPLSAQNVAANVLKFGTGALNIDATRLAYQSEADKASATPQGRATSKPKAAIGAEPDAGRELERVEFDRPELKGRWPANVLLQCTCDDPQPVPERAQPREGEPSQERRYDKKGATDLAAKPGARRKGGGAIHTDPDCPAALLDAQSGVLKSGTGAVKRKTAAGHQGSTYGKESRPEGTPNVEYGDSGGASRFFPTMHTDPDCPAAMLDDQSGVSRSSGVINRFDDGAKVFGGGAGHPYTAVPGHDDFGGASRFFYCSKATKKERGAGNTHPTVKPLALMRWLVRLVTPPEGVVVDPFMGTGTTLLAAIDEGFSFVGIDISPEYCEIALRRVKGRKP